MADAFHSFIYVDFYIDSITAGQSQTRDVWQNFIWRSKKDLNAHFSVCYEHAYDYARFEALSSECSEICPEFVADLGRYDGLLYDWWSRFD